MRRNIYIQRDNTCTDQDIIYSEGFRVVQVSRVIFPWGDNAQLLRRHTYRYYWTYAVIPRPMQTVLVDKRIRMCLRIACGCRERHYIPCVVRANANSNASSSPSVVLSTTESALERTARAFHCKGWEGPVTMLKFVECCLPQVHSCGFMLLWEMKENGGRQPLPDHEQ